MRGETGQNVRHGKAAKLKLTRVRDGGYAVITGIGSHNRQTIHTRPLEWLEEHRAQFTLASGHLCNIPVPDINIDFEAEQRKAGTHRPPWGLPNAAKCLHVAAMRAIAVELALRRRPLWSPVTYAWPISPVLNDNDWSAFAKHE